MPLVTARAPILPTEDPKKVEKAVLSVFPDGIIESQEREIVVRSASLDRFRQLIRNYRILDSTRKVLLRGMQPGSTSYSLHKQVAFVGKISFMEEQNPLGRIEVTIEADDVEALIDEVAPVTINGEEVPA
jgi:predicted RNA binding protein with dsRBD fold (UPF0201 family)